MIDRTISGIPFKGSEDSVNVRKCDIGDKTELEFELLLDVSSLEVFIDGGRHVMTANVYPDPEDTEVRINVIDCHQDTKYGFVIDRLAMITDEEYPIIFLDIDSRNPVDITAREDE